MAHSVFIFFPLFVALLVGVTTSNAQGIDDEVIIEIMFTGNILCPGVGNALLGFSNRPVVDLQPSQGFSNRPVVGVHVTLLCDSGQTVVGQAVTNATGMFHIIANASTINLSDIPSCLAVVTLPISSSCAFLRQEGSLQAPIIIKSLVHNITGYVLSFEALPFEFVPR